MNLVIRLFIFLSLFTACGKSNKTSVEIESATLGAELGASQLIEGTQKAAALKICYAFKSKNTTFRASYIGSTFSFALDYENCSGAKIAENSVLETILAQSFLSNPMMYDSTSTLMYLRKLETEQHGELVDICKNILNGLDVQSIVSLNSEQKKEYKFVKGAEEAQFSITVANKSVDRRNKEIFKISEEHRYFVNTSSTAADNRKGIVYKYSFRKSCASDTQEEILSQTLVD